MVASYTLIALLMAVFFYFRGEMMIEGYTTIKVIAEKWGITPRRIQILCLQGKILGAVKFGRDWAIPSNAKRPNDGRITTGEYVNWRNKLETSKSE